MSLEIVITDYMNNITIQNFVCEIILRQFILKLVYPAVVLVCSSVFAEYLHQVLKYTVLGNVPYLVRCVNKQITDVHFGYL